MQDIRSAAKKSAAAKLASYKSGPSGSDFDDNGSWGSSKADESEQTGKKPRVAKKCGGSVGGEKAEKRLDRAPRKKGGFVPFKKKDAENDSDADDKAKRAKGGKVFEGSPKDEAQDKKLAAKRKMSMKEWEASDADKKHDAQESMEGLKKGGRAKRANGGPVTSMEPMSSDKSARGKKPAGKTTVNIIIGGQPNGATQATPAAAGPAAPPAPPGPMAPPPMMPPPGVGGGIPPQLTAALGGAGGPPPGMGPKPFKAGGRVHMTAGALSGPGRLEKIDEYGANAKEKEKA